MIRNPVRGGCARLYSRLAAACLLMGAASPAIQPACAKEGVDEVRRVAVGKRMYREGVLPSGKPMLARVQGDVPLAGTQVACVSCHRRSGLGATEGQTLVPAVSSTWLFQPREIGRREFYAIRREGPGTRPAYSDQTLARAIREGIDAAGRQMDPLMPRYELGGEEVAALIAYLKSLSSAPDPGVTDTDIHFATVITEGVAPASRKALLDVLDAYFRDKNADTRSETRRAPYPAMHKEWKYQAYRRWVLHLWDLTGPAETWRAQLDDYYRHQPVFALISGIGTGSWRPVHAFCKEVEVPCVLPNTDRPPVSESSFYSIYFSRGLVLEAEAVASDVSENAPSGRMIQVYRDDNGAVPANAFRAALAPRDAARLEDRPVEPDAGLTAAFWSELAREPPEILVLWLSDGDLAGIRAMEGAGMPGALYLSSTLCRDPAAVIPKALREPLRLAYPFALAEDRERNLKRVQPWMRARGIPLTDVRIQLNAYYTARLAGESLMHIRGNFSRDYFIERIEHAVDRLASPSAYPHLSLGPDQRFASKGSYILKLPDEAGGEILPPRWVVP